jgi:Ca2+-binding EF-hand superfamily protein
LRGRIQQFDKALLHDSAKAYPRIAELIRTPLGMNFVNAVDSVWLVNGLLRPSNPFEPKKPPSQMLALQEHIESGEYGPNEYLLGKESRRVEYPGIFVDDRVIDRMSPLLLLATGFYGWGKATFELILSLLDKGADANFADRRGLNALFYLVEQAPWSRNLHDVRHVAKRLMDSTDLRHRDEQRRSLLHVAVEREQSDSAPLCDMLMPRADEFGLSEEEKSSISPKVDRIRRSPPASKYTRPHPRAQDTARQQKSTLKVFAALRDSRKSTREIKQLFARMDTNDDGLLSSREFAEGLREYIPSMGYQALVTLAEDVMTTVDQNGDNAIDVKEFIVAFKCEAITSKLRDKLRRHRADLHRTFDAMDSNRDGVLSRSEFRRGLETLKITNLSSNEMDELMHMVDADGDDHIDFNEFLALTNYDGPTATTDRSRSSVSAATVRQLFVQIAYILLIVLNFSA